MAKTDSEKISPLREKSMNMAIRIVRLCHYLSNEKREFIISKQLFRAGTNPGAMVRESANAESGLDFIHKLSIAQKETGETQYWLELLFKTGYLTETEYQSINADADEIMRLLRSSILTRKKNLSVKALTLLSVIFLLANMIF
jgi:four helix bundle protein